MTARFLRLRFRASAPIVKQHYRGAFMCSQPAVARVNSRVAIREFRSRIVCGLIAAVLLSFFSASVRAQASLTGTVREESSGQPLANAEVRIDALERATRTDSIGRFLLAGLPAGQRVLNVRLIGYHPAAAIVELIAGATAVNDVALIRAPATLDTVAVVEEGGAIPEFEEHRRIGLGRFLTRAELAKVEQRRLSDVLETLSGLQVMRGIGNRAWITSRRGSRTLRHRCSEREGASPADSRPMTLKPDTQTKDCACFSQVYLDDMLLYRGEGGVVPDINRFSPAEIEAIEYYAGPAQTPLKYSRLDSECGVVVIHTRRTP